jgi:hypothetical protein
MSPDHYTVEQRVNLTMAILRDVGAAPEAHHPAQAVQAFQVS